MRFAVLPLEDAADLFGERTGAMRKSVDGGSVIVHVETLLESRPELVTLDDEGAERVEIPYPVYEGAGLDALLDSAEWKHVSDEL